MAKSKSIYIACGDYDFSWKKEQVKLATSYWKEGVPLPDMAKIFRRRQEEVLILLVDLAAQGGIRGRLGGILGKGW